MMRLDSYSYFLIKKREFFFKQYRKKNSSTDGEHSISIEKLKEKNTNKCFSFFVVG